ncbi:HAD family hydrolase [Natronosalvus vescus]|uniref:HAD family hydrolase n=1 Tax=Natronosalvus vescus TaxID=2953881 RepID=UPI0020911A3F|nr:HAD family hydrolase [Natronosalvus vescus]
MAVSFDLFGTLVRTERPADPATAVAAELEKRDVAIPEDWHERYARPWVDAPEGAEVPLPAHVGRALASAGIEWEGNVVRRAVVAAFDPVVAIRPGAPEALEAARERGSVGLCSNCSVPELVGRTLIRAGLDRDDFDAIVTSIGCGWRKPAPEMFEVTASRLDVDPTNLIHVGDDPRTDGGIEAIGGTAILLEQTPLEAVPGRLDSLDSLETPEAFDTLECDSVDTGAETTDCQPEDDRG